MRALAVAAALLLTAVAPACAGTPDRERPRPTSAATPGGATSGDATPGDGPAGRAVPGFSVRPMAAGRSHVWDVQSIGHRSWLFTERDTARLWLIHGDQVSRVAFPSSKVWVSGETGLMSLAIDPGFARNRRFYTCQGGITRTGHDVRVMAWRLSDDSHRAITRGRLLGGLPSSSGRHAGCRLLIARGSGALYVGTGDAAVGTNPRDLTSLGGKVLRLDRRTGAPWPGNPWIDAKSGRKRYVLNFGHRNVQGLAQRRDGTLWSVEHGPDRDDEVNRVLRGADYGWNPVPGYNESVPMTDQSLPGDQVDAAWSSGYPTLATSGAVWVYGAKWGSLSGTLAVAALKDSRIIFLRFDADGAFVSVEEPAALQAFGRVRSLTLAPNHDLIATTDNGTDDQVLRITPGG